MLESKWHLWCNPIFFTFFIYRLISWVPTYIWLIPLLPSISNRSEISLLCFVRTRLGSVYNEFGYYEHSVEKITFFLKKETSDWHQFFKSSITTSTTYSGHISYELSCLCKWGPLYLIWILPFFPMSKIGLAPGTSHTGQNYALSPPGISLSTISNFVSHNTEENISFVSVKFLPYHVSPLILFRVPATIKKTFLTSYPHGHFPLVLFSPHWGHLKRFVLYGCWYFEHWLHFR